MEYSASEVLSYVEENDVKFIKLFFTDIYGNIKSLTVQPSMLKSTFEEGISFDANAVKGFLHVNESDLFITPDPATLSVLPWRPQHGRVARLYCNIKYPDGNPFEGDSRMILKNVMKKCHDMGYEVKVGTECEFYLLRLDENGMPSRIPSDCAGYCDLAPLDKGENVRRDIILTLEQMGITPEASHHESGPGQNEIDFKYDTAIRAADNLTTFKNVVKTISAQDGFFASFLPKPMGLNNPGSGLHINLSLYKNNENCYINNTPDSQHFTAGILSRIKEITAFLNPLRQSYERLGSFEAPKYISWSSQNRSQLIRVPAAVGDRSRIELRSPDCTCNQYISLALIIAAGLEGIEKKTPLPPSVDLDLYSANEEQTKKLEPLPTSLNEALECAEKSEFVKSIVSEQTLKSYIQEKSVDMDPEFWEM
ncbi:MAG: glutamine synthetase [Treponema sp.]|nr:glutamine synthetase [Treponema sp.]